MGMSMTIVTVLIYLLKLLYVNFLSKGGATGAMSACFLIWFTKEGLPASSSFHCRYLFYLALNATLQPLSCSFTLLYNFVC